MRRVSWLASLSLLLFPAACSSSSAGSTPDASSEAAVDAGPSDVTSPDAADAALPEQDCGVLAWSGDACAACTAAHCCSLQSICAAIPACGPLSACTAQCRADASCGTACGSMYTPAVSNYAAILNCQSYACPSDCAP